MIIDHIGIAVADYRQSREFYCAALAPLGIGLVMEIEGWAGLGRNGKPEFWFGEGGQPHAAMHIAFAADTREQVRSFHESALAAGGRNSGLPGVRAIYHPDYYGAFIICPNGHNIEAVCHRPGA